MMNTRDVATYVVLMRYTHLCALFLTVSIVATVRLTFGARYDWLAALVIALRILVVVVDFLVADEPQLQRAARVARGRIPRQHGQRADRHHQPLGPPGRIEQRPDAAYVVLAAWAHARPGRKRGARR